MCIGTHSAAAVGRASLKEAAACFALFLFTLQNSQFTPSQ